MELTGEAGEKILPLIDRAEEELTVYSPFISPRYAKMLVEKAKEGVDVNVYTLPSGNGLREESARLLQEGGGDVSPPAGQSVSREGVGVLLLSVGALLAMVAYSAYMPVALFSALSFLAAVPLLWSGGSSDGDPGPGSLTHRVAEDLHAKVYSRDGGEEVIFGSPNLTEGGMSRNLEVIGEAPKSDKP